PLQMIMMSLASLIGVGTASIFSRKIGNNDLEGANKAFGNLILLVYLFSIFTFIFGFIFLEELVSFLGASNEVLPYAIDYARSILPG
ncbi:MATE family efflux transporter, partial [Clostridium perfringens]